MTELAGRFEPEHLPILDQAVHLAGDLVSEAFQLDLTNYRQWPVDTRHYPDLAPDEIAPGVLAQVLCYRRQALFPSQQPDFYRVCLYDPAILEAANRESLPLPTLLAYVLTHEYIHVARFIRFLELVSLEPELRSREESLVHAQTRELLAGRDLPGLGGLLELFNQNRLALDPLDPLARLIER
ncbi:MAG: hypothetical protein LBR11_08750 [Deltaproteobacteria bacterium]|jgi:hypothetical protein|nr:hypothetical protein [Deltaproteobacteria bacterium]